ncbi:MAG: hypothetical protein WC408_01095 [Candidatus Micrarchaeia archaeon]|jgi:hypothetical protein
MPVEKVLRKQAKRIDKKADASISARFKPILAEITARTDLRSRDIRNALFASSLGHNLKVVKSAIQDRKRAYRIKRSQYRNLRTKLLLEACDERAIKMGGLGIYPSHTGKNIESFSELKPEERKIAKKAIVSFYAVGHKPEEIADHLGISQVLVLDHLANRKLWPRYIVGSSKKKFTKYHEI